MTQAISCKGTPEGLRIVVRSAAFQYIADQLGRLLRENPAFFRDGSVRVTVELQRQLEEWQRQLLFNLLCQYFDETAIAFVGIGGVPLAKALPQAADAAERSAAVPAWKKRNPAAKLVRHTLRGGQEVEYDGDVVVLGDVNAGAKVRAAGSVVVLGNLRGVVHAGTQGDERARVYAQNLQPVQVRIADRIAIPDARPRADHPETARILGGKITIQPYVPGEF